MSCVPTFIHLPKNLRGLDMRRPSDRQLDFATLRRDQVVAKSDHAATTSDQLVAFDPVFDERARRLIWSIWPKQIAAAQLSIHGGVTVRQAQRILGRKQGFSLRVYGALMRSLHGEKFLDLIMDGSPAAWWREVGQERRIRSVKQRKRALEAELRELEAER